MLHLESLYGMGMDVMEELCAAFAAASAKSLPLRPTWLGNQQKTTSYCELARPWTI
jgi:hypothetical protein